MKHQPRRERREKLPDPAPGSESGPDPGSEPGSDKGDPERLYVITGGPDGGDRAALDLVTMVVACSTPSPTVQPEQAAILRLCRAPLSVAEISAYLRLPFSVVTSLLTDLLATELVESRAPIVRAVLPDRSLLEAVMHGLQRL